MKGQILSQFPNINLVVIGQLIFFTVFLAALFWVFRSGSQAFYEQLARLPLEEENQGE